MSVPVQLPNVSAPAVTPQTGVLTFAWVGYLQEVTRRLNRTADAVADPAETVPAAGAAYDEAWADAVTAAIAEIQTNQAAILAALRNTGAISE